MIEFSPRDVQRGETPARKRQAVWVIEHLREVNALTAEDDSLLEPPLVGERPGQIASCQDCGKSGGAEPLLATTTFQQLKDVPQELPGPRIQRNRRRYTYSGQLHLQRADAALRLRSRQVDRKGRRSPEGRP
jgi:hypothetical protein